MKSINEIIGMVASELSSHITILQASDINSNNYNKYLGDTSFLMAALLDSILHDSFSEWPNENWIDDSLISYYEINENTLTLEGIMIFGKSNTNKQWIDPFQFNVPIVQGRVDMKRFQFKYGDMDLKETTYEIYRDYYDPEEIINVENWKYIIDYPIRL